MSASTACDGLPHLIPLLAWAAGAAAGHEGCEAGVAPAEMRSPPWSASWEFGYGLALCRKRRLLKWSSFGMLLVAQRVNRKRNRCFQEEMLTKLARREKTTNIKPDHDIDVYMKASTMGEQQSNIVTDYTLKLQSASWGSSYIRLGGLC
uniref:Uncharacterized protein n=1 Tax=Zea mays TaxID=4577 RepID=A0A804UGC8_MAIZE